MKIYIIFINKYNKHWNNSVVGFRFIYSRHNPTRNL